MTLSFNISPKRSPALGWWLVLPVVALPLFAQQRDSSLRPNHTASLTIEVRHAVTGELVPARVYLFRGTTPHRLSPVDNLLPLFEDNFYRERIWRMTDNPKSFEVDIQNQWHDLLLEGKGTFDVPAGDDYRLEAYHGFFWSPGVEQFALDRDQPKTVVIRIRPIAPGRQEKWISGDEHIHLMRAKEDDSVFLKWLRAFSRQHAAFPTPAQPGAEQNRLRGDAAIRLDQDESVVPTAQRGAARGRYGGLRFSRPTQPLPALAPTPAAAWSRAYVGLSR